MTEALGTPQHARLDTLDVRLGESVLAVLTSGEVVTLRYASGVGSHRRWVDDADGVEVAAGDVAEAGSALAVYAERLARVTGGRLSAPQWREALKLALRQAGAPGSSLGHQGLTSLPDIAESWIERLEQGAQAIPSGGAHAVEGPNNA